MCGAIGALLIGISIAGVAWAAYGLGLIGSCSSTGRLSGSLRAVPYCSTESTIRIVGIFPFIAIGLLGLVIAGRRAPRGQRSASVGLAAWVLGYLVVGGALIASGRDPANTVTGADQIGWMIPGVVFVVLGVAGIFFSLSTRRRAARAQRLVRDGVRAPAVITSVEDTNMTINGNPRVRIGVEVRPPGGEPFQATKSVTVSRLAPPQVGDLAEVFYDESDPERFALALKQGVVAAAGEDAAATPTDTVGRLERLAALHERGALTDEEFKTGKAALLEPGPA